MRPRPPRPPQPIYVVREADASAPLKAGSTLNILFLIAAACVAGAVAFSDVPQDSSVNAVRLALGAFGAMILFLLGVVGELAILILCIVAMIRGAAIRAVVLLVGTLICAVLGMGMIVGAGAYAAKKQREKQEAAALAARDEAEKKDAGRREESRKLAAAILADAPRAPYDRRAQAAMLAKISQLEKDDAATTQSLVEQAFRNSEIREWTDRKGRKIEARFEYAQKNTAGLFVGFFERSDGTRFEYKVGELNDEGVQFLRKLETADADLFGEGLARRPPRR